jgi:ribosomal protein S12 methylthiotransferase accessory factor YcaO
VNVVALFVIFVSIIPVWIAQRIAGGGLQMDTPGKGATAAAIETQV